MPRHVPASVTELSRIGLLASVPGERLLALAGRMRREEGAPGSRVVSEGDLGNSFYVVLSGMFTVTQEDRGERGLLRPGDTFGEVSLALRVTRTASVTAMTPAVVASCDCETFDEFLRPLFADD